MFRPELRTWWIHRLSAVDRRRVEVPCMFSRVIPPVVLVLVFFLCVVLVGVFMCSYSSVDMPFCFIKKYRRIGMGLCLHHINGLH